MKTPLSTSPPVIIDGSCVYTNAIDIKRQTDIARILQRHGGTVDLNDKTARNNLAFNIVADLFYPMGDA